MIRRTSLGWRVEDYDLARSVLLDAEGFTVDDPRFSTGAVLGESMLSTDGATHQAHRNRFAATYRARAVASLEGRISEITADLLGAGVRDYRADFAGPLAVRVMIELLGLDIEVPDLLACYRSLVAVVAEYPERPERAEEALRTLRSAMGDVDDAYFSNTAVILFGGIETVEGMIVNALWMIYSDDDLRDSLVAEPALVPETIEESLRVYPSVVILHRYATADVELAGEQIGQGDLVEISIPDSAGPDRHLAFATGPHVCLGMHLARLEARVAVGMVLQQHPQATLDRSRSSAPEGDMFRKAKRLALIPGAT